MNIGYLRQAWEMYKSDDDLETVVAAVIVAAILGPLALSYLRRR